MNGFSKTLLRYSGATNMSYSSPHTLSAPDGSVPFYSSAPQHHQTLTNTDDLQLTAQLTRGLAPIMNAGPGGPMPEGQDLRSQDALNQQYTQEQEHQHVSQLQSNHGPVDQMGIQYGSVDETTAPRKRSKVSRACDECRRKKIRCDATGEAGDEQCSSCIRVAVRCQFSRVPMKRGPSKGYIKELADRLNILEGTLQVGEVQTGHYAVNTENPQTRRGSEEYPTPLQGELGQRKRTYSTISADLGNSFQPQRPQSSWASPDLSRNPPNYGTPQPGPSQAPMFNRPNYSPGELQPSPQWRNPPELVHQGSSSFESMPLADPMQTDQAPELGDNVITGYYDKIHPTYPLLPESKIRLVNMVSSCPGPIKLAFSEALQAAVQSFTSSNTQPSTQHSLKQATALILEAQFNNVSSRSMSTNLVYLQTTMLMAIQTENMAWKGQGGMSRSFWLGSAVGLAFSLKLHLHNQGDKNHPDSDRNIARRIWWSLVIMDRWHASSTSSLHLIPEESVVVHPDDESLLGESLYHLARLTIILGHFTMAKPLAGAPALGVPHVKILDVLLRGELERWRETLPSAILQPSNDPTIHLCYWYCRILLALRCSDSDPSELLTAAMNAVTLITNNSNIAAPLVYHSTALAALALVELSSIESTKATAETGLKEFLEGRTAPSGCDVGIRELISKKQNAEGGSSSNQNILGSQHAITASQGLQRLADLATATETGVESSIETRQDSEKGNIAAHSGSPSQYQDLRDLIHNSGYLSVFNGEGNR